MAKVQFSFAQLRNAIVRARAAAANAAEDAVTKGWWQDGGRDVAIPMKSRRTGRKFWVKFDSVPYTTRRWSWDWEQDQPVPSGALMCAAAKAACRELGLQPNNRVVIKIALLAASWAGDYPLGELVDDPVDLITFWK